MADNDTQDQINQLQSTLTVPPSPSLFGIQGPPDPAALQTLLAKLRQQQFLQQAQTPTPGPYGYLHDAGKSAFTDVGQQLGNALGGAVQLSNPNPPAAAGPTPQAAMTGSIVQAQRAYQAQVAAGVDENTARQNATKMLVAAGVPGAADVLAKANQQGLDNGFKQAETDKDTSQGKMDQASILNQQDEQKNRAAQRAQEGQRIQIEQARLALDKQKNNLDLTPDESAKVDTIAQKIANYDLQMNTAVGRGSAGQRQAMLERVISINPDFDEKNFKQSQDALKAYGPSGTQGQMVLRTQNAMNHLSALDAWGAALKTGDVVAANKAKQFLQAEFSDPNLSTYNTAAPIVANEVSAGLVKGGGSKEERLARVAAFTGANGDAARSAAIQTSRSLLGAQYSNNENLYKQTSLRGDFRTRFPVAGGFPPPPGPPAAATAAPTSGWGTVTKAP